ncbi:Uncharacterized protein BM_BM17654 [Brugia malayi]|uniref:Uncharacterized protein n=1 Tax=Brugia malayi TaxID=6279 RepID=A0A4E9FKN8_BRUMA|nr:Uncharacterized protein BM_BM17654 [Brugia malayi]VIO96889.1 Uncharacterized protein BM_BM17654 [Brugia malayi]
MSDTVSRTNSSSHPGDPAQSLHGDKLQPVVGSESIAGYFERSIDFLNTMLRKDKSSCMITYTPTIYIYTRYLLKISATRKELDSSDSKVSFCSLVVMEKDADDKSWKLGKPIKMMNSLSQSTKIDYQFLLNKRGWQSLSSNCGHKYFSLYICNPVIYEIEVSEIH